MTTSTTHRRTVTNGKHPGRTRSAPLSVFAKAADCRAAIDAGFDRFLGDHCHSPRRFGPGWTEYLADFCLPGMRVTPSDIEKGIANDPVRCPNSLAAKRTPLGRRADFVVTCKTSTKFVFKADKVIVKMDNDPRMRDAIAVFDEAGIWFHREPVYDLMPAARAKPPKNPGAVVTDRRPPTPRSTRSVIRSNEIVQNLADYDY